VATLHIEAGNCWRTFKYKVNVALNNFYARCARIGVIEGS